MKRNTLLILLICNLLFAPVFAQQYQNFYTVKSDLDSFYDSLIFINGNAPQSTAPFTLDWKLVGPNKMPEGSTAWAKGLGQIHYIAFDPNDPTKPKLPRVFSIEDDYDYCMENTELTDFLLAADLIINDYNDPSNDNNGGWPILI